MYSKNKMLNLQTKTKTLDILVEFFYWCLLHNPCSISVYCTILHIRHRVPGDFMHLVDV